LFVYVFQLAVGFAVGVGREVGRDCVGVRDCCTCEGFGVLFTEMKTKNKTRMRSTGRISRRNFPSFSHKVGGGRSFSSGAGSLFSSGGASSSSMYSLFHRESVGVNDRGIFLRL